MAYLNDLKTLMNADASINALITGDIVYEHLNTDFNTSLKHIVYGSARAGDQGCLKNKDLYSTYALEIQVVGPLLVDVENIATLLNTYLLNYDSSLFLDINFNSEEVNISTEKDVYYKNLSYSITYLNG